MSSKDFGLGPKWWQKPANKLRKCSERKSEWCDPTETDGWCAVIPCTYCLELEIYGQIQYGTADFTEMGWEGRVGGGSFFAFWEIGYESQVGEFVVQWNGEEVYRKSCDDGQSCRDSSDEVGVIADYEDAILRWSKHEFLPLEYVRESETGCVVHFCDECECSCDTLCATIRQSDSIVAEGELPNISYPCLPPVWAGIIGEYDVSLALGSNEYGQCIITPTVDGVELPAVLAPGCTDLTTEIDLEENVVLQVRCKKCSCSDFAPYPCECRLDATVVLSGVLSGTSSHICAIDPISGSSPSPEPTIGTAVPEAIRMWPPDWECRYMSTMSHRITAFPPLCTDPDNSRNVVFVKKSTDTTWPGIDNDNLQIEDWYAVVYTTGAYGPVSLVSVNYEYLQCCKNETPNNAATSHLIWVKFLNVDFGEWSYDLTILNPESQAAYGDCA